MFAFKISTRMDRVNGKRPWCAGLMPPGLEMEPKLAGSLLCTFELETQLQRCASLTVS